MSVRPSAKASRFTESVIREMTRLAKLHGAVNLSQGFPDFPAPEEIKEAARRAVAADINQYAITWGARPLREAIARKFTALYGVPVDPEREITVTCGSTEAMIATLLAVVDPGDEVVVFEPFYEPPLQVPTAQKQKRAEQSLPSTMFRSMVSLMRKPPAGETPENVCSTGLLHTPACVWVEPVQAGSVPSRQESNTAPVGETNVLLQLGSAGNPRLGWPPTRLWFVL